MATNKRANKSKSKVTGQKGTTTVDADGNLSREELSKLYGGNNRTKSKRKSTKTEWDGSYDSISHC